MPFSEKILGILYSSNIIKLLNAQLAVELKEIGFGGAEEQMMALSWVLFCRDSCKKDNIHIVLLDSQMYIHIVLCIATRRDITLHGFYDCYESVMQYLHVTNMNKRV